MRIAVEAERLGYARLWLPDEGLHAHDVWVALGAIAKATTRLRIGPGITNPYTRLPKVTANAVRSLNDLSGGRAFLGIGVGGSLTLKPLGVTADRPLASVRELLDAAREMNPGMEIWLGAKGPRLLDMGAQEADGVLLSGLPLFSIDDLAARLRPAKSALYAHVCLDAAALDRARPHFTYQLTDTPDELREQLGISREDAAAGIITNQVLRQFVLIAPPTGFAIDEFVLPVNQPEGAFELMRAVAGS